MSYYPLPDIPVDAPPNVRRFCEQVRSIVGSLEKYGQPIEVHQPFYAVAAIATAPDDLDEFPVYRADAHVELLYATWTTAVTGTVGHNLIIRRRPGDGGTTSETVADIRAGAAGITAWAPFLPKRFSPTTKSGLVPPGQLLTLHIDDAGGGTVPWGVLSMYLRRVGVS